MKRIYVFQVTEDDAVAARSGEEALEWYEDLTGCDKEYLYSIDELEQIPLDKMVLESIDNPNGPMITVGEIVGRYWKGEPFIALTSNI